MEVINIKEKLASFQDHWNPRIIGALNGQEVRIAKIKGDFVWHSHENEDELFYVLHGELTMEFRDKTVVLQPGEMIIVPKGIEHRPRTTEEVHILLFEPASTVNTGALDNERTIKNMERL